MDIKASPTVLDSPLTEEYRFVGLTSLAFLRNSLKTSRI